MKRFLIIVVIALVGCAPRPIRVGQPRIVDTLGPPAGIVFFEGSYIWVWKLPGGVLIDKSGRFVKIGRGEQ